MKKHLLRWDSLTKPLPTSPWWRIMVRLVQIWDDVWTLLVWGGKQTLWFATDGLWFNWTCGGCGGRGPLGSKGATVENELLRKQLHAVLCNPHPPFCTHTLSHISEALISHNSDVLLSSTPHPSSFTQNYSKSWQPIPNFPLKCRFMRLYCWLYGLRACVYVLSMLITRCMLDSVNCFVRSRAPDLPALIRFHRGRSAHRTGTTHFRLGLCWRGTLSVCRHLQPKG